MGIKEIMWREQKGLCFYCQQPMRRRSVKQGVPKKNRTGKEATFDHYIPKSIIPAEVREHLFDASNRRNLNLVLACLDCNGKKGDSIPGNWDGTVGPYRYTERGWVWVGRST